MPAREAWRFEAIGTSWEIETDAPLAAEVRGSVSALIDAFDRAWSRFRPDSSVSALAAGSESAPMSVTAPRDAAPMLDAFVALSAATGGGVNPLVGRSLESLGYDAGYSLAPGAPRPAPADWTSILTWDDVGADGRRMLSLSEPATIDVGALGKGRLVDLVCDEVARHVPGDLVVDASGDLAVRGAPVRVGLEHPYDPRRAIGVWEVAGAALCASASNRRAWGDGLHHVLDARTGLPVRTIAATWAVAPDALHADAIATALFFEGGPQIAAEWRVEWVRMTTDGRVEWSPDCKAEVFS